jgi:glycosyltransferase involved in cell wall biosynthesis
MRLICPVKPSPERGGAHSFLLSLSEIAREEGAEIFFGNPQEIIAGEDVLLVNSFLTPLDDVEQYWRKRMPIFLRLDGATRDYGRYDEADKVQSRIAGLADVIVFQSAYSRHRLLHKWGLVKTDGKIIYNGVDTALFCPHGDRRDFPGDVKVAYVSHSTNLLKGFRRLVYLARNLPDVTFIACTPAREEGWPDEALAAMPPPPNLLLLGRIPRPELPPILRGCDLFASCSVNDPCPNSVIEAMACGLPVWYHPSGGTPELVESCGVPFSDNPARDLEKLLSDRERVSDLARKRVEEHFDIRQTAQKYLETAEELLQKKRRGKIKRSVFRKFIRTYIPPRTCQLPDLRVAYFLPANLTSYEDVPASLWIRCFQMIRPLSKLGIEVLINPGYDEQIDLAVIQRLENERGVQTAGLLKEKGVPYIFDMTVNYLDITRLPYDQSLTVTEEQKRCSITLSHGATVVTAVSPWLADRASSLHDCAICVPDAVPDHFYELPKKGTDFCRQPLRACYVGASLKSNDLLPWLQALENREISVTLVCEKEPPQELKGISWKKWKYDRFAEVVNQHEIGLAPRKHMDNPYNKGHSSFKIASLMACGVPVIASPVPSYFPLIGDRKAGVIASEISAFESSLDALISDRDRLCQMSVAARERVRPLAVSNVVRKLARVLRQAVAVTGK